MLVDSQKTSDHVHECYETCHSITFIVPVNSHQRWKQTLNRVCFHLQCELTLALWCHSIVWSLFSWNKMKWNDKFHGIHVTIKKLIKKRNHSWCRIALLEHLQIQKDSCFIYVAKHVKPSIYVFCSLDWNHPLGANKHSPVDNRSS